MDRETTAKKRLWIESQELSQLLRQLTCSAHARIALLKILIILALTIHPRPGQILLCDFSSGFKEPEMVKSGRPVVVLAGRLSGRERLVTVAALSTKKPEIVEPYHYLLPRKSMPQLARFQEKDTWLKGDMLYTVAFHRLDLIQLGKKDLVTGKRRYFQQKLGQDQMKEIYKCVLAGMHLGQLGNHL